MKIIFKKISVIGLGLIGTSILHALKNKVEKKITTYAYDIKPQHRSIVRDMNIATIVSDDIEHAVKNADLIILSIPVGSMKKVAILDQQNYQ